MFDCACNTETGSLTLLNGATTLFILLANSIPPIIAITAITAIITIAIMVLV